MLMSFLKVLPLTTQTKDDRMLQLITKLVLSVATNKNIHTVIHFNYLVYSAQMRSPHAIQPPDQVHGASQYCFFEPISGDVPVLDARRTALQCLNCERSVLVAG